MHDKFTERVRKVIYLAREEAARLQHDYIGTEHLLLGVIREGEGIAATVLNNLGLDLDRIGGREFEVGLLLARGVDARRADAGAPLAIGFGPLGAGPGDCEWREVGR